MTKLFDRIIASSISVHAFLALAAVLFFQWIKGVLDASYAASKHPVDFFTGQTGFNGPELKGYYASMLESGTLDIYVRTQVIDFGFVFAMALLGIFFCTLVARISRPESWGRRIGILAGVLIILGAFCDAIENGWSFMMLSNPTRFADWLAVVYSSFAALKFLLLTLGMLALLVSLLCAIGGRVFSRPSVG